MGVVLDRFAAVDGAGIGGNWKESNLGGADVPFRILSNQLAPGGAAYREAFWTASVFGPACAIGFDVPVVPVANDTMELFLRVDTRLNGNGYALSHHLAKHRVEFGVYAGPRYTAIGPDAPMRLQDGDAIAFSMDHAFTLTAWQRVNGVWTVVHSQVDLAGTYSGAGFSGFYMTGADLNWRLENFSAAPALSGASGRITASEEAAEHAESKSELARFHARRTEEVTAIRGLDGLAG